MTPNTTGNFSTNTASLVVFDPLCLANRIGDDCDWWSDPMEELAEINAGNAMFAGLGCDGMYALTVYYLKRGEVMPEVSCKAVVKTVMGSFYIGAGEEVIGESIGPSTQYGGMLFSLPAGNYEVGTTLDHDTGTVSVYFEATDEEARNAFSASPRI